MTREGPAQVLASAYRIAASDEAAERGPWLGRDARCPGCGRRIFSLETDGYCSASTCGGDDEYVRELNRRAGERARAAVDANPAVVAARLEADAILKRRS